MLSADGACLGSLHVEVKVSVTALTVRVSKCIETSNKWLYDYDVTVLCRSQVWPAALLRTTQL